MRDTLLELIPASGAREGGRARALVERLARLTGPHFRYEEERMYPALGQVYDEEYLETLFQAHDRAIGAAEALVGLAGQERLPDGDVERAIRLVRQILPHVSDCDGLSIMVETLPPSEVEEILDARQHALRAGLDLLRWAREIRTRPIVAAP